jgi:methylenetetrahydrofolate reductase (NADPH)
LDLRIPVLYGRSEPTISFEFFPPKTDKDEADLFVDVVPALKQLGASYISVTYGAGGGTRDRTLRIVDRIRREFGVEAMSHVTCVGHTAEQMGGYLEEVRTLGHENLLALRGDPPRGQATFQPTAGGFSYAVDLIRFVKSRLQVAIGAACYPEGHVECSDKRLDWDRTVAKVEEGAEFLITQLFYDVRDFFEFEDYMKNKRGIRVPIVPGILPFINSGQIKRITSLCGARMPEAVTRRLDELAGDDEAVRRYGVEVATDICRKLLDAGVPGIHFYCLNRVPSSREILQNLGLAPRP